MYALQLCAVLDYLHHQNIIFRDLKPSNIMVEQSGMVRLIDFGIARLFKPGKASDTAAIGTLGYAPPEQYGSIQTDLRSDVYSLGATLRTLLTGFDQVSLHCFFHRCAISIQPFQSRWSALSPQLWRKSQSSAGKTSHRCATR